MLRETPPKLRKLLLLSITYTALAYIVTYYRP